jgi:hemerythrin-like domain-containing protein
LVTTDPFEVLEREHHLIARVLEALSRSIGRGLPLAFYARALEFLDVYATQFHHAKEEDVLYRHLIEHGMPRDYGPLGVVLEEHDYGDAHLAAMREHLEAADEPRFLEELKAHLELLRAHIQTENDLLLPMGRAMLTAEEVAQVAEAFAAVPAPAPSAEAWEAEAERLCADAEVSA